MEQIIITKPNGTIVPVASKSAAIAIISAKQTWELLGNDVVEITVQSPFKQHYGIGDRLTIFGRTYKINRLPKIKKIGGHIFQYDLEFEGVQYDLARATFDLTIDTTNNLLQDVQADSLTGDLRRFATTLVSNANRVFQGVWKLGTCPETISDKTLTFGESDNCLSVLQNLCKEFDVEFEIEQSNGVFTINFTDEVGQIFPHTFQFGKGKGLYSLDRQNVDSSNIVTRLKVYGSTSNITNKYRANRLCLPEKSKGQSYIEKSSAVAKYGIYEATKFFEDIKPTFTGEITSVVVGSVLKFVDTAMFDLNEKEPDGVTTKYLLPGVSAKIHFNTGNLAGYEFDVHAYDHATKTFTIVKITDDRGDVFPSESSAAFQFRVGDKYKIIDVALPQQYETEAENNLLDAGNEYYKQNSQPKVEYGLSVTKAYLKQFVGNGTQVNIFTPGDYIPVKDDDIDVDKSVRIKALTRNLLDEYDYTLTISDTVTTNITNRVISDLIDLDKIVTINNLKNPARARNNWRNSQELLNMIFDPEGDYYTEKIKPASIDTEALSVGAKSMQFGLTNTVFEPNYEGNKNVIKVTGGVLTHYTIDENAAMTWVLANNITTLNSDEQVYYIYAKCLRNATEGLIIFSVEQIKVEQDKNYYHFWIGVVNSVDMELKARSVALTFGFTMINGRFIKTGRIESSGGSGSFFDLDNNQFRIGDTQKSLSWNEDDKGQLLLKGILVQSQAGETQPLSCFRGDYKDGATYYQGDEVTYNGSTYRYVSDTPSNDTPTNATFWAMIAAKGTDGENGNTGPSLVFRGDYNSSATYYGTANRVDSVKYNGIYYVALESIGNGFSNKIPTDENYWKTFGSQFDSVATDLLLAKQSFIDNLIVKALSTGAPDEQGKYNAPYIKAMGSEIVIFEAGTVNDDISKRLLRIGKGVGSADYFPENANGMAMTGREATNSFGVQTEITTAGIFTNGSDIHANNGTNASIAAILQKRQNTNKKGITTNIAAAIWGYDITPEDTVSQGYGGFFNSLFAGGLSIKATEIRANHNVSLHDDTLIVTNSTVNISITLPVITGNRYIGKIFIIHRLYGSSGVVTILANGSPIYLNNSVIAASSSWNALGLGNSVLLAWLGSYWMMRTIGQ